MEDYCACAHSLESCFDYKAQKKDIKFLLQKYLVYFIPLLTAAKVPGILSLCGHTPVASQGRKWISRVVFLAEITAWSFASRCLPGQALWAGPGQAELQPQGARPGRNQISLVHITMVSVSSIPFLLFHQALEQLGSSLLLWFIICVLFSFFCR